jgi:hypothetical protein
MVIVKEPVLMLALFPPGRVLILGKSERGGSFPAMPGKFLIFAPSRAVQPASSEEPLELIRIDSHAAADTQNAAIGD